MAYISSFLLQVWPLSLESFWKLTFLGNLLSTMGDEPRNLAGRKLILSSIIQVAWEHPTQREKSV